MIHKLNCPLITRIDDRVGVDKGLTVTVKLWVALRLGAPLSATISETGLTVLALDTAGRQEKAPVLAFNVPGPFNRLKVRVWGG